jgi:hypothetical protein
VFKFVDENEVHQGHTNFRVTKCYTLDAAAGELCRGSALLLKETEGSWQYILTYRNEVVNPEK